MESINLLEQLSHADLFENPDLGGDMDPLPEPLLTPPDPTIPSLPDQTIPDTQIPSFPTPDHEGLTPYEPTLPDAPLVSLPTLSPSEPVSGPVPEPAFPVSPVHDLPAALVVSSLATPAAPGSFLPDAPHYAPFGSWDVPLPPETVGREYQAPDVLDRPVPGFSLDPTSFAALPESATPGVRDQDLPGLTSPEVHAALLPDPVLPSLSDRALPVLSIPDSGVVELPAETIPEVRETSLPVLEPNDPQHTQPPSLAIPSADYTSPPTLDVPSPSPVDLPAWGIEGGGVYRDMIAAIERIDSLRARNPSLIGAESSGFQPETAAWSNSFVNPHVEPLPLSSILRDGAI